MTSNIANQILSDITVHMKYARYLPSKSRRETWKELVTRNRKMHMKRYPELKATQNFLEFQSQLEGTENRINVERNRYNEAVNTYNTHIKIFPNSIYAGWLGFGEEFQRFSSSEGSQNAPEINFD